MLIIMTSSILNYIGSKKSLLNYLDYVLNKEIDIELKNKIFFDGFAGSGIVSKYFNRKYDFINYSNDLEYYSYVINYVLLKCNYSDKLRDLIEKCNNLEPKNGLITENYSENGEEKRLFWTIENSKKADAILYYINDEYEQKNITFNELMFIKASLLSNLDKVANTASVYGAFLKNYKTASLKNFILEPIHNDTNIKNIELNKVFNDDVNNLINNNYDIVYLDPPYNGRQYSSNYHPLNFVARYDSNIELYGKTGLLKNSNKSKYSISKEVKNSFNDLITNLKAKYILLSYNNEGLMSSSEIRDVLQSKGKTTLYKYEYKKFKSQKTQIDEKVFEYLYVCKVGKKGNYTIIELDSLT